MEYKSIGKPYNNEKAIISLTSWKARINTVSKTIFSLIKMCPGFHIVLVLSEEEFKRKEQELPDNLMLFIKNNLIELLWVYKNYKSFKKILFTKDKYPNIPVISADDDCIYKINYAEELYEKWLCNKNSIVCNTKEKSQTPHGYATLHPPVKTLAIDKYQKIFEFCIKNNCTHDDMLYRIIAKKFNIGIKSLDIPRRNVAVFHDTNESLSVSRKIHKIDNEKIITTAVTKIS